MWEHEYLVPGPVCDIAETFVPFFQEIQKTLQGSENSPFWLFSHKCESALATPVEKQ